MYVTRDQLNKCSFFSTFFGFLEIQESLMVYVNYTSFYDLLECDSETEMAIASKIGNGYKELSCYTSSFCLMTNYEIHNCNENDQRTRRDINNVYIGYTVTLACNTTKRKILIVLNNTYKRLGACLVVHNFYVA